jgi:hypothetical protein
MALLECLDQGHSRPGSENETSQAPEGTGGSRLLSLELGLLILLFQEFHILPLLRSLFETGHSLRQPGRVQKATLEGSGLSGLYDHGLPLGSFRENPRGLLELGYEINGLLLGEERYLRLCFSVRLLVLGLLELAFEA